MKHTLLIIGGGQLGLLLLEESTKLSTYIKKIYIYTDTEENCCKYLNYDFVKLLLVIIMIKIN